MIKEAPRRAKPRAAAEALQAYASTSATLKDMKERQAKADADVYYRNLLEKAKNQARLQADSDYSRLLADERSAIAPRIDKEIAEHLKLLEERRQATSSMLQALTLDAEKEMRHRRSHPPRVGPPKQRSSSEEGQSGPTQSSTSTNHAQGPIQ
jgi:hypothetical protein